MPQIDAECKAEFGRPPPQVKWYIDEPSNLLDDSFSTARMDRRDAATVISSLHFTLDQQMSVSKVLPPSPVLLLLLVMMMLMMMMMMMMRMRMLRMM